MAHCVDKDMQNDADRNQLAKDLDDDLQKFISGLKKRETAVPDLEEIEKQVKEHPLFLNELPEDGQLPPLVEALQSLKYDPDENSPEELAQNYKDDGNFNFKVKKYRRAVDAYTEGLKQNCCNVELLVQLHTNRAAAHYHLGNFRKSLVDCQAALKLKPGHMKAIIRGAHCSCELKLFSEALDFCERGLQEYSENADLLKLKCRATKEKKLHDRDTRKAETMAKKQQTIDANLLATLKSRQVKLAEQNDHDAQSLEFLNSSHPAASRVALDEHGCLSWPVLFMYPEYSQTELVKSFHENIRFVDQLVVMFGPENALPEWDEEKKYKLANLKLYYEAAYENMLVSIGLDSTLSKTLQDDQYVIKNGTPTFIILVGNSDFEISFLKRYNTIKTVSGQLLE